MGEPTRDAFDQARSFAAAFMVAAGAAVILGTVLDWVTLTPPPIVPIDQEAQLEPFTGLDTKSAPYLLIAAGVEILAALMLVVRRRSLYAWLGFFASMVIGAIAFQNYRGLDELSYVQMDRIGEPSAAIGLLLVVGGSIGGLIAGAAGIAGSPQEAAPEPG